MITLILEIITLVYIFLGACVTDQQSPTFNPHLSESQSFVDWLFAIKPRDATTILDVSILLVYIL